MADKAEQRTFVRTWDTRFGPVERHEGVPCVPWVVDADLDACPVCGNVLRAGSPLLMRGLTVPAWELVHRACLTETPAPVPARDNTVQGVVE